MHKIQVDLLNTVNEQASLSLRGRTFWRHVLAEKAPFFVQHELGMMETGPDAAPAVSRHVLPAAAVASLQKVCKGIPLLLYSAVVCAVGITLSRFVRRNDMAIRVAPIDGAGNAAKVSLPLFFEIQETATVKAILLGVKDALEKYAAHQPEAAHEVLAPLEQARRFSDLHCHLQTSEAQAFQDNGNFAIVLCMHGTTPELHAHYRGQAHNAAQVERLLAAVGQVLGSMLEQPLAPTPDLSTLPAAGIAQVLALAAKPQQAAPVENFRDVFIALCDRFGAQTALSDGQQTLSFTQLKARALQLADATAVPGVRNEGVVCLHMQRGVDIIVAMAALLCAGISYVPIDPAYPDETLREARRHTGSRWIITDSDRQFDESGLNVLRFDAWLGMASGEGAALAPLPLLDRMAYVILTSGSTGSRKAAAVAVSGLLYSTRERVDYYAAFRGKALLLSSVSFDSSVALIFGSLFAGNELVLPPAGVEREPNRINQLVQQQGIATVLLLPSLLGLMLDANSDNQLDSLKLAIVAGEAVGVDVLARVRAGLPALRLFNEYGPTEATVWSSVQELVAEPEPGQPVPIGMTLRQTHGYVLDPAMRLLPFGVKGELYLGGPGLAFGYLNDAGLTASRFLPDPFAPEAGQRMYATGDLVAMQEDGRLVFHGRTDGQLKIRGYRIEPAEVEALLRRSGSVRQAAVTDVGGTSLVALIVGEHPDPAALRDELAQKAPAHMVPDVIVQVDAIPRLPNGKIDRHAVATLIEQQEADAQAPEDALECRVHDIWCSVLGRKSIAVDANFFSIGGNSISAAKVINQIQRLIDDYMYVVALFEQPTIQGLATYLRTKYPQQVARLLGLADSDAAAAIKPHQMLREADFGQFVAKLAHPPRAPERPIQPIETPVVFVLAPPRSGTTLLRVMLAGGSSLFSPPELELCGFADMQQRNHELDHHRSFFLEGAVRAVMEVDHCSKEEAQQCLKQFEAQQAPVSEFYRYLMARIGNRILVDKTASYSLSPDALQRASAMFPNARYIHLFRHPYGMIHSFESARLDLSFLPGDHDWDARQLGELVWQRAHENIMAFRQTIRPDQVLEVSFEETVANPESVAMRMASFLGIPFEDGMLDPYGPGRMTDGISPESKMLGDIKFHEHQGIEASVAHKWLNSVPRDFLHPRTMALARSFHYAPRNELGRFPLSFQQRQIYFVDQAGPGGTYNVPWVLKLDGVIAPARISAALESIVHRHAALRTRFVAEADDVWQYVDAPSALSLDMVDLRQLGEDQRKTELDRLIFSDVGQHRFDLEHGPLYFARLVQTGASEAYLYLNIHHIVCDAWSLAQIGKEFAALLDSSQPLASSEAAGQYTDYAAEQANSLNPDTMQTLAAAWDARLGPEIVPSVFPADMHAPAALEGGAENHYLPLGAALSQSLRALASQWECPLSAIFMTAFQILLARHSGKTEVFLGSPVACRTDPRFAETVGNFVNLMVVRGRIDATLDIATLVKQVQVSGREALAIQHYPFEQLVENRATPGKPGRKLIETMFSFQSIELDGFAIEGLRADMVLPPSRNAKFDFTLLVRDLSEIACGFEYARERYHAATIARIANEYLALLQRIGSEPGLAVADLLRAAPAAQAAPQQAVQAMQQPAVQAAPQPAEPSAPEPAVQAGAPGSDLLRLFALRVAQLPDHPAIISAEQTLSYRELDDWSTQLALNLGKMGAQSGDKIALQMPRGAAFVAAVLAVTKLGCAYVPFSVQQPVDGVTQLALDAGCRIMLASGAHYPGLTTVEIESRPPRRKLPAQTAAWPDTPASALLYVVFTSGSTGKPKAVAVSHFAMANYVNWTRDELELRPWDRATLVNGIGFDALQGELWSYLCAGSTVMLPPDEVINLDHGQLVDWMSGNGITVAFFTTYVAENFLRRLQTAPAQLRLLMTGGEALSGDVVQSWPFQFANAYGPSEATVLCTFGTLEGALDQATPGIGFPIANTRLYLLDEAMQPVPPGQPGELYIGGDGLAWGYLNDGARTAERFVPDPFVAEPGARMYRTGDLMALRSDNNLAFMGRIDDELKIDGVRIHPLTVENMILAAPGVEKAVVIAVREDRGQWLEAFVKPAPGATGVAESVRAWLRTHAPHAALIPARIDIVSEFTYGVSNKINRASLRELAAQRALQADVDSDSDGDNAPLDAVGQQIQAIFSGILHAPVAQPDASFFELGGTSRKLLQLVSALKQAFPVELSLRDLLTHASVRQCAGLVAARLAASHGAAGAADTATEAGAVTTPVAPLQAGARASMFQEMAYLDASRDPDRFAHNIAFGFLFDATPDMVRLEAALQRVLAQNDVLRMAFDMDDAGDVIVTPAMLPAPVLQRAAIAQDLRHDFEAFAQQSFDLECGPLFRACWVAQASGGGMLMLGFHHSIFDGISVQILIAQLQQFYRDPQMAVAAPHGYARYAAQERMRLQTERQAGRQRWVNLLQGYQAGQLASRFKAQTLVEGDETGLVREEAVAAAPVQFAAKSANTSVFNVLLAAYFQALTQVFRLEDLVVGVVVNTRTEPWQQEVMGPFLNTLPIRARLAPGAGVEPAILALRDALLSGLELMDVPLPQILADLAASGLADAPLIQCSFTHQDFGDFALDLAGMPSQLIKADIRQGKLPLQLFSVMHDNRIELVLRYERSQVPAAQAQAILQQIVETLAGLPAQ